MRNFLLLLIAASCVTACNNEQKSSADAETEQVKPADKLPYEVTYSSSFEIAKDDYSAMILQGSWKDWQNNTQDNMRSWVADTIVAYQSDFTEVYGVDSLQARWKRGRAQYSESNDSIQAVIPVYSKDRKENWVLVWAKAIDTKLDGTKDTSYLMETWRINKDGKADMLFQFDRARRKK